MHVAKRIDLALLERELAAAAVPVDGLGMAGPEGDAELFTYADGQAVDVPPEAGPVVDAHVAPPRVVDYAGAIDVDAIIRTVDAAPATIYRLALEQKHGYRADVRLTAIDAGNGALRSWEARFVFKRLVGGAIRVGAGMVADIADTQAAAWAVAATASGNDLVVTVTGADGRTIDWLLVGSVGRFAPGGVA